MDSDTRLAHAGRDPERQLGLVNPPVYRGSTVIFPTMIRVILSGGATSPAPRASSACCSGPPSSPPWRRWSRGCGSSRSASFGGFESLIVPARPSAARAARPWREPGFLLRLHVGLEAADDLIADLEDGFARLHAAGA